ncbi:hypothetical protein JCM10207_002629 [Rhodosporidiobolus poonsookiae]
MAKGARHELKGKGKARDATYKRGRDKTRSSKPTLIEDPELEEKVLNGQLREAGLYAANILGDGNCLFRALSDQLYGSPSMHLAIRHEICDYLSANPEKYRFFIDEDSVKGGFDGHVREMRQPGTYGTNIELSAFVARYRRPVKVYQPNLVYVLPVEETGPVASAEASSSTSGSPPPEPPAEDRKLTPRERRLKAREEKENKKPGGGEATVKGKGKGKQKEAAPKWQAPDPHPFDGTPLCIVYHSWEHYSSLRNLDGPHTGPPRLRVARIDSPQPSEVASPALAEGDDTAEPENGDVEMDDGEPSSTVEADSTPPTPPPKPTSSTRRTKETDARPLPSVRAALARAKAQQAPSRVVSPPSVILPRDLPPLPPSSSASPAISSPLLAGTDLSSIPLPPLPSASPRPPKHTLDRSRPRSPSASSSSSSSGATFPLGSQSPAEHDETEEPDDTVDTVDENDNDRVSRRLRSRTASRQQNRPERQQRHDSPALSTSTASTGVASQSSGFSGGGSTSASSPPEAKVEPSSADPDDGFEDEEEEEDDEVLLVPVPASRKARPPPRTRRGPTASEKKELARQRRMERRRAKGIHAQPVAGAAKAEEGRVLRSGRTTGDGDAGLSKVRELYI